LASFIPSFPYFDEPHANIVLLYFIANAVSVPIVIYFTYSSYFKSIDYYGSRTFSASPFPSRPLRPQPQTKTLKSFVRQLDWESPAQIIYTLNSSRASIYLGAFSPTSELCPSLPPVPFPQE